MKFNTIPNWITLGRFILYLVVMGLLLFGNTGVKPIALPIYIIVFLLDKVDGYVARKYNQVSDIGKFFDLAADRAIVATLLILYVFFYPNVWVLLILVTNLVRDFMVGGLRQLAAIKSIFLKAHIMGKFKFITENTSVVLMVYLLSWPGAKAYETIIHQAIFWILIVGSVLGWSSFYLYLKQVFSIKEK